MLLSLIIGYFCLSTPLDTEVALSKAVSPDGTWNVKVISQWDSSYFVVWMEAFDRNGTYIGRSDISWLEGAHGESRYGNLSVTTSEAVYGDGTFRTIVPKADFESIPRHLPHPSPCKLAPNPQQRVR